MKFNRYFCSINSAIHFFFVKVFMMTTLACLTVLQLLVFHWQPHSETHVHKNSFICLISNNICVLCLGYTLFAFISVSIKSCSTKITCAVWLIYKQHNYDKGQSLTELQNRVKNPYHRRRFMNIFQSISIKTNRWDFRIDFCGSTFQYHVKQ